MKVLFIGGTGNISSVVSRKCLDSDWELYLLNRGKRVVNVPGAHQITGDITNPNEISRLLDGHTWDVVVDWIAFTEKDIERDISLFKGKTGQYIFISSASVYQKPPSHPVVTESTPLANPFWEYSRNKIACECKLNREYRETGFPVTIVRPSLTYNTVIPVPIGSWEDFTIVDRMRKGKKIIVHGDGTSLWTITHAEDFAGGFCGLMGNIQATGHSFHITSDEILTWNQIYRLIAEAAGTNADIIHIPSDFIAQFSDSLKGTLLGDKAVSVIFDNTKIKTFVPGYKATIPFKLGIQRTIKWFDADPSRMKIIDENNRLMDKIIDAYGHCK